MIKITVILVLACCVYGIQATSCGPPCKRTSQLVCAADGQIRNCHRLSKCDLERENCRRRQSNRPLISHVAPSRCRNLPKRNSRGPCAPVSRQKKNTPPTCNQLQCTKEQRRKVVCTRSKDNLCQRLTQCQMIRVNCKLGPLRHLQDANDRRCKGMKLGEKSQKCRR